MCGAFIAEVLDFSYRRSTWLGHDKAVTFPQVELISG